MFRRQPNGWLHPPTGLVSRTCAQCGVVFLRHPSIAAKQRFCTTTCRDAAGQTTLVCPECGTEFTVRTSVARKGRTCCTRRCDGAYRTRINLEPATFWSRVNSGLPDECWLWQGKADAAGYGRYSRNKRADFAHRVAWELTHNQRVPAGLIIRHTCDNPPCCNPSHLVIGTHRDNGRDMVIRDRTGHRMPRGSAHPAAKLSEADVRDIRAAAAAGATYASLSRQYNIVAPGIRAIVLRRTWKHV